MVITTIDAKMLKKMFLAGAKSLEAKKTILRTAENREKLIDKISGQGAMPY